MNTCIFTICAKNYIGLALVLEKSIKMHNQDCDFFILVADEIDEQERGEFPDNVLVAKNILGAYLEDSKWSEMAFKYNLTEFCTSIKPLCFQYVFEQLGYQKAIYLDPDILTFSSFNPVFEKLDDVSIVLTPHITTYHKTYQGHRSEKGLMSTGVFNLGFLALKNTSVALGMLTWWAERLKDQCYVDPLDSYFTDQKWMDFLPCFFGQDELHVSKHLGLNLAPWNFFEREIYQNDGCWMVKERGQGDHHPAHQLIFVHFSGYNYKGLIDGIMEQNNIPDLDSYHDIDTICKVYRDFLLPAVNIFNQYIKYDYTYNYFDNGVEVSNFQRRLFRGLVDEGEMISQPFSTLKGSFYTKLVQKKLLLPGKSSIAADKLNKFNMPDTSSKLMHINRMMRILFKIIGLKNYALLLKLFRPYSKVENQIHLLDTRYSTRLK